MAFKHRDLSAITWTPDAAALIIVSLRTFVRIRWRRLHAEDLLMLAALCFFVLSAALSERTLVEITTENGTDDEVRKYNIEADLSSVFVTLSLSTAKFSVAILLLRLIASTARRKRASLIVASFLLALTTILIIVATILPPCKIPEQWRATQLCFTGDVLPNALVQLFNYYSACYDIFCSYLPISFIHRLQISRGRKIFIGVVLSLGWLAAILAILRAVTLYAWSEESDQGITVRDVAWNIEPALVMLCGSLSSLGPLFGYFWGSDMSSSTQQQVAPEQNSRRGGSSSPLQLRKVIRPRPRGQRRVTQSSSMETLSDANTGLKSGSSCN